MSENRAISEMYEKMGAKLIESDKDLDDIRAFRPSILYLTSDKEKKSGGMLVKGECEKVQDKNKWAIPAEYLIIIYEKNCQGMSDKQMEILLKHELLHIKIEEEGVYKIRKHDLNDFKCITREYGADWSVPGYEIRDIDDDNETY